MKILKVFLAAALIMTSSAEASSGGVEHDWRFWGAIGAGALVVGGVFWGMYKFCTRKPFQAIIPDEERPLLDDHEGDRAPVPGNPSVNSDGPAVVAAIASPVKRRSVDARIHGGDAAAKRNLFPKAVPDDAPFALRLNEDVAAILFPEGVRPEYSRMSPENFKYCLIQFVTGSEESDLPQLQQGDVSQTWLTARYLHMVIGGFGNDETVFPYGAFLSDDFFENQSSPEGAFVLTIDKKKNIEEARRVAEIFVTGFEGTAADDSHQKMIELLAETV